MALTEKQEEAFERIKQKSDDDYEKNVVYIAAGTLVLSMTFLEKIIKVETSTVIWVLITSWVFLALTLLCNLLSHQLSSLFHESCRDLFDECSEPSEDASEEEQHTYKVNLKKATNKMEFCNKTIRYLNWGTTLTLFLGIALLVVFCSANAIKANTNSNNNINNLKDSIMSKEIKPQTQTPDIKKGRTISASVKPSTPPSNTSGSSSNQSNGSGAGNNQSGNK